MDFADESVVFEEKDFDSVDVNDNVMAVADDAAVSQNAENSESVEDIDERRLNRKAYDYLCRLLEVRTWLSECVKDDAAIPPVTELERTLSNGVLLARLGNSFAPDVVPTAKIFDIDQERYRSAYAQDPESSLHYRHSDNIMLWRRAMESVRLPEIFIPETVDVYEGRNMKTIFCLYALAFHLFRMRKAPPIRNQAGTATFTNDELAEMRDQLKDSAVPEFGDVGGMLTDRVTEDEKVLAAAIERIEKAVEEKNPSELLNALQNHDAQIMYVESELDSQYLESLEKAKSNGEKLTRTSVQNAVTETNYVAGINRLNELLSAEGDVPIPFLLDTLQWLQFEDVRESAIPLYITMLKEKRRQRPIQIEDVRTIVTEANALVEVKLATLQGSSLDTLSALKNPTLQLDEVRDENAKLYYNRLFYNYEKSDPTFYLTKDDLNQIVFEFEDLTSGDRTLLEVAASADRGEEETLLLLLKQLCMDIVLEENIEYYVRKINARENKTFDKDELRKMVAEANLSVKQAFDDAELLVNLNHALLHNDVHKVPVMLRKINWHRDDGKLLSSAYRESLLNWYTHSLIHQMEHRVQERRALENGEKTQNGGDDHKVVEWFYHDFFLGTVYIEVEERRRSTKKETPENRTFLHRDEFEKTFAKDNAEFDRYYKEHEEAVKKSQRATRRFLEKKRLVENNEEKLRREEAAKKIQESYRHYSLRKDQDKLRTSEAPPLQLVRRFVTYLQDKDYDMGDELDIEEKKSKITQLVVSNQELDGQLHELDEKIGLLIKNRINLQDVIAHKNKISDDADKFAIRPFSVRKKDRDSFDKLEQLFFHLQADPEYLARLILANNRKNMAGVDLHHDVLGPIFGYLTEKREQFLMVRLLCELLLCDVEKSAAIDDFLGMTATKSVTAVLNSTLFSSQLPPVANSAANELKVFMAEEGKMEAFNLNPDDIYHSIYGQKSPNTQAAVECPHVGQVLESSKKFLADWSESISTAISSYKLPPSVRYIALFLEDILQRQFPNSSTADVQKTVSEFVYEAFVRPQVTSPRQISLSLGKEPDDEALLKLDAVMKFVGFAVANKGYGSSKWYLSSLNKQIHLIHEAFKAYVSAQLGSESLDEIFGMNVFTHFNPTLKPTLTIVSKQMEQIIKMLKINVDIMAPDSARKIRELMQSARISSEGNKSIVLYLHPMSQSGDPRKQTQELFVRTKKYLVDLLLSGCVGVDVPELLSTSPSEDNEDIHKRLFNQGDSFSSLREKQHAVADNLKKLEETGRVSSKDRYQSIVTDIANDIRLATRRRKERIEQRHSLDQTEKRLETQRKELKDRLTRYEEYLDTCLENLSRNARRLSFRPTSTKAEKIQKARTSVDAQQMSYKCSGEKLHKKGVLESIEGYETKKLGKVQIEFSGTDRKGVFRVHAQEGKDTVVVDDSVDFQELLQAGYAEDEKFRVGDKLTFSVKHLVIFINKKFYNI